MKGFRHSKKWKRNRSNQMKKLWDEGKFHRDFSKAKEKISKSRKGKYKEENCPNWKGNKVKYNGLHQFVASRKPKPQFCEECGKEKKLELANIKNHNYTRNPKDYKWLCRKCHSKLDNNPKRKN